MTNNINKYKEDIEWDLNLLFQYDTVWPTIYNTLRSYNFTAPKANLFGTPSNIWAGGQIPGIYGEFKKETLKNLYAYLQQNLTNPILNFSNTNLTKEDLKDEYANFILETSFEYNARFIVYSDYLRDYIKEKNPDATVVASVIKANCRFQGPNKTEEATIENETNYYNKLLKEYDIVVVRPEYSKDILPYHPEYIDDISRLEVLINQPCIKNCPKMPEHYKCTEKLNTNLNQDVNFECIKNNIPCTILYENNLIHDEETIKRLTTNGIKHIMLSAKQQNSSKSILYEMFKTIFDTTGSNQIVINDAMTSNLKEESEYFNQIIGNIEGLFSPFIN